MQCHHALERYVLIAVISGGTVKLSASVFVRRGFGADFQFRADVFDYATRSLKKFVERYDFRRPRVPAIEFEARYLIVISV